MHRTASSIGTTPRNLFRAVAAVAAFGMVAGGLALVSADPASAAPSMDDQECQPDLQSVNYPAYVVPEGVHLLTVDAYGGAGGSGGSRNGHGGGVGGLGAHVTHEKIAVTPGQKIWTGRIDGGSGGSTGDGSRAGYGGEGEWVAFANWSGFCIADGLNLIAVAGGGGGGGDGDANGPGGTGGNAGAPGNPGGDNQNVAGGGGGAGTMSAPGAGGAGGNTVNLSFSPPFYTQTPMNPGYPGDDSGRGGAGNSTYTRTFQWNSGGGGGGGVYGGGGGGASGDNAITGTNGTGAGGGGGGGSYPSDGVATSTYAHARFTPIYDTPITLSASPNPGVAGQPVTLTATVTSPIPDQVLGGGVVSFSDRGDPDDPFRQTISLGSFPVDASATSWTNSVTVSSMTRGYHQVQAYYTGFTGVLTDFPYSNIQNAASRSSFILNVQGDQSITFTAPSGSGTADGATSRPVASSTSGLPVRIDVDLESQAVCSLSDDGVLTYLTGGTCVLNANQAGDDDYAAAPQAQLRIPVAAATGQTITFTTTPPAVMNGGDTYTPHAVGGGSGNPVVITSDLSCQLVDGVVIAKLGGLCGIRANQAAGNGYSAAAQVMQVIRINPVPGHMLFQTMPPDSPQIGDQYTVIGQALYPSWGAGDAVLTVDEASTACTMSTPFGTMVSGKVVQQAVVTYTAVGTCIINANVRPSIYLPPSEVQPVAQLQQISTVAGEPQAIAFTSTDPIDLRYGGSMTVTATGGDSGNPVTFATTTPATCTITGGSVEFVGIGDCDIAADQLGDSTKWGAAPTEIKTLSIAPAPLTVTAPSTSARHGAALSTFAPEYDGFVNGDDSSSLQALATCVRSSTSQDVGSYTVTCAGAVGPNYSISYIGGTATITAAPLTITASSSTTGYGLAVPQVTASYDGLVNGATATATVPVCGTTATDQSPVGTYLTTCVDAADPNYTVTVVEGTISITHATLVITPAPVTRTYGDAAADITPTYVGLKNDDTATATTPTCTAPVAAETAVGDYVSTCSGADDANYTIDYSDGQVHVTPAALTVVAPHPTTPYGTPVAAGLLDPQYLGLVGGDAALATPATCLTTATPSSPVGTYPVDCSGAVDPNYTISYQSGALSVTTVPLTITAPTSSALYGTVPTTFAPAYDGFVTNDDPTSLAAQPLCVRSSTSPDVGSYPVTCSGAADSDYTFVYVDGTQTITQVPLAITASSGTTGYGLAVPTVTASYDGLVSGDTATATAPTCVTTATDQSPVGDYATSCSGAADPNYTITTVDGTLSITHATLVIAPATTTRSYGEAAAGITPTYLGLESDDTAPETPPTCTAPVEATTAVGDYVSTCSGADDQNYTIAYSDGVVHVTPAALTVVAPHPTTPYGTPVAAGLLDPQYLGLAGGDAAPATPATCLTTATPSSPVDTYPVDCSGAVDSNYTISYQSGAMSVATVPLTVTASSASIVLGASVPAIVPSYSGLVLGQSAPGQSATCVAAATQHSLVGTYPATCSGAADGNYAISYIGGTLTIVAPIVVAPTVVAPPVTVIGTDPDTTVATAPPTSPSTAHDSPPGAASPPASDSDADSQTSTDGTHAASEAAGVLAFWLVLIAVLLAGFIFAFVLIARRSDRAQ